MNFGFELTDKQKTVIAKALMIGAISALGALAGNGDLTVSAVVGAFIGGALAALTYVKDNLPAGKKKGVLDYFRV